MRFMPLLIVFVALASAFAGCGQAKSGAGDPPRSAEESASPGVPGPSRISRATLAQLLPQASDYQKALLSDETLTLAEYEGAKLAQVACLKDRGLVVVGNARLNGLYLFRFMVAWDGDGSEGAAAVSDCRTEFASVVDMVWPEVSAPLAAQTIAESRRMMADCYRQNQVRVEDTPQESSDPRVQEVYTSCLRQMQTALDMEGVYYGADGDGRPQ